MHGPRLAARDLRKENATVQLKKIFTAGNHSDTLSLPQLLVSVLCHPRSLAQKKCFQIVS